MASLREMGHRWKEYVKQGQWIYEDHAFWISGYTFWALKDEGELPMSLFLCFRNRVLTDPLRLSQLRICSSTSRSRTLLRSRVT